MYDASKHTNLVQVGIRSMDSSEKQFINRKNVFFACDIFTNPNWIDAVLSRLHSPVYITVDLDVFDPAFMPATGTPEPGGLNWYQITSLLRKVFENFHVIGFDLTELAPIKSLLYPHFTAAKLYYKMLSYKFCLK
jgi:agmatinase